jgi:hypothetical protein
MIRHVFVALVISPSVASAQSIVLPRLDSVNFYGEVGDLEAHEAKNLQPVGTFGWGFEAGFTVASSATHMLEISLGYDTLFEHARFNDGTLFTGELRDLPSISVYTTFSNDMYVGIATGVVALANATVDNGAARFSITGDTFDAAAKVGYTIPFQPGTSIENRRIYGFIEADYHARYFGGLNYGAGAPLDLPGRMYLGGFTLAIGIQISLDGKNNAKAALKAGTVAKPIDATKATSP